MDGEENKDMHSIKKKKNYQNNKPWVTKKPITIIEQLLCYLVEAARATFVILRSDSLVLLKNESFLYSSGSGPLLKPDIFILQSIFSLSADIK